jgi:hypothetical protein
MVVDVSSHTDWLVLIRESFPAIPVAIKLISTCEAYEVGFVFIRKLDPKDEVALLIATT